MNLLQRLINCRIIVIIISKCDYRATHEYGRTKVCSFA